MSIVRADRKQRSRMFRPFSCFYFLFFHFVSRCFVFYFVSWPTGAETAAVPAGHEPTGELGGQASRAAAG